MISYGVVDSRLHKRLALVCASLPLELAVLFGSRASGRVHPRSDVDVGVMPLDAALSLHDELAFAAILSTAASAEVDLVRLDVDDALLGREVARTGIALYERTPGAFAAYRARAMSVWVDMNETLEPHRAHLLRRLSMAAR
jgi:predicted nucleotidyltransferase